MADLNKTIDRSMAISRNVAGLYAGRVKEAYADFGASLKRGQSEYTAGASRPRTRSNGGPIGARTGSTRSSGARCSGTRSASAATSGSSTRTPASAAAALPLRDARRTRARTEHPCNHALVRIVPPAGTTIDDTKRPLHHHRPARGPRPGHRRLQGRLAGRRRAARRPRGLLRRSSSASRSPGRRCSTSPTRKRSSCASCARCIPTAPKPALIGNCQGGWAAMMLAAARSRRRPARS